MSWSAYTDPLIAAGTVDGAAIIGRQGGLWGSSGNLTLGAGEDAAIAAFFSSAARPNKIAIGGKNYMILNFDEESRFCFGKDKSCGCVMYESETAIIIATHNEKQSAGNCSSAAAGLCDTLKNMSY